MNCPSCAKQIPENSTFCLHCGTKIRKTDESLSISSPITVSPRESSDKPRRIPFLSQSAVAEWRDLLGGLEGWSPFFTPSAEELELFSTLEPPLDVNQEQFIFCPRITARAIDIPHGPFSVGWVTIRGRKIEISKSSFLLGTNSRLVAYYVPGRWDWGMKKRAIQVLYREIVSLDIQGDHFILHLTDGGIADLHMRISRPGVLAAMAVMGAPTGLEKGMILDREKARASDAQSFVRLFSQFFAEIIDQNRRS